MSDCGNFFNCPVASSIISFKNFFLSQTRGFNVYFNLILSLLAFLFAFISLKNLLFLLFKDLDEMYSDYRNKHDKSESHFKRLLLKRRIMWLISTIVCSGLGFYILTLD